MNNYNVIIVGAGTAGLMLARELGKNKINTLVLDRKDNILEFSFNTLGSFINLKEFDLTTNVVAQKIETLTFYSKNVKRSIKCNKDAYVLDKKKLHEEILNSIDKKYINILTNINIKDLKKENNKFISVIDKNNNEYFGDIFVDASGTAGILSKKVGLIAKKTALATGVEYNVEYFGNPNKAYLLAGKDYQGGYGWIFPLKNKRAIIGFGTYNKEVVKNLKQRLHTILEIPSIKKLVKKDNDLVEGGSIPITPVLEKFVLDNLVCVGDSVSQVNPIVGEGYKFIFESAIMASKAIIKYVNNNNFSLSEYETEWKNRFSKNYKRSKRAQEKIYKYSDNDYVMDIALFLMKFRSNKKVLNSISGEYGLE